MTIEEKRAALQEHPETITLEILGEPRHWNFGRWGLRLARAKGINVDDLFDALAEDSDAGIASQVDTTANLLLVGLLPFDENAGDVLDLLSLSDFGELGPRIIAAFESASLGGEDQEPGKPTGADD